MNNELSKMSDTETSLEEELVNDLKSADGSSLDMLNNSYVGGDMENLINDGVPGYETTGVDGTDDQIGDIALKRNKGPTP